MTNEPEWRKKLRIRQRGWKGLNMRWSEVQPEVEAFIQDTIKEEKEKAKAELLSKIEEEVNALKQISDMNVRDGAWMIEQDEVSKILSKYKVNK